MISSWFLVSLQNFFELHWNLTFLFEIFFMLRSFVSISKKNIETRRVEAKKTWWFMSVNWTCCTDINNFFLLSKLTGYSVCWRVPTVYNKICEIKRSISHIWMRIRKNPFAAHFYYHLNKFFNTENLFLYFLTFYFFIFIIFIVLYCNSNQPHKFLRYMKLFVKFRFPSTFTI